MKSLSQQQIRLRKLLLVLPLLALPFLTLAFWALGGGKGAPIPAQEQHGINTSLPDARLTAKKEDKLSLYRQYPAGSEADTSKDGDSSGTATQIGGGLGVTADWQPFAGPLAENSSEQERMLRQRLDDLERLMREPATDAAYGRPAPYSYVQQPPAAPDPQLERLERLMEQASETDGQPDAELDQLNGMLERVLDIQHPDRYRQRLKDYTLAKKGRILPVGKEQELLEVPLLATAVLSPAAGQGTKVLTEGVFYGLDEPDHTEDSIETRAIAAVVPETQTVVSGASLKLKLTEDVYVAGMMIPSGTPVYGACNLEGERLIVHISGLRLGRRQFPVDMTVYGLDAMEGIRIPGAISRDATKEGADRAVQSMQLMTLDPSLGAQAAGAGIEAAKGLFSKKVKLVRATVNAGLQVLLVSGPSAS